MATPAESRVEIGRTYQKEKVKSKQRKHKAKTKFSGDYETQRK
jgi:hypothetical protein